MGNPASLAAATQVVYFSGSLAEWDPGVNVRGESRDVLSALIGVSAAHWASNKEGHASAADVASEPEVERGVPLSYLEIRRVMGWLPSPMGWLPPTEECTFYIEINVILVCVSLLF